MRLSGCLLILLVTGCAHGNGDFCLVSTPIRPALTDVLAPSTEAQILTHNEIGGKLCGWQQ